MISGILGMKHITSQLKENNDQRSAEAGTPKGGGHGEAASGDVEYHLKKGTTPDDLETAEKVINARMKKESTGNMFSEELYNG